MATTVEHTIGTGGDYATVADWITATANPIADDSVYIGKLLDGVHATASSQTNFGVNSDTTRYRILTYANQPYDASTDTGPKLTKTWGGASQFFLFQQTTKCIGVGFEIVCNGQSAAVIYASNLNTIIDGCTVVLTGASGSASATHAAIRAEPGTIRNCTVIDKTTSGGTKGVAAAATSVIDNVTVYGSGDAGIYSGTSSVTIRNVAAIDCGTDFSVSGATLLNCASSDLTASGAGCVDSVTAAAAFEDSSIDDFRPKDGGPLDSSGTDLSGTFTTDITGATRSLWSIGSYDAPAVPAIVAVITKNFATTEYIPAHFAFSAWDSTTPNSIHTYGFKWTVSGGSEHDGVFTGPNLGLVWRTAGTFTVRLDILDADGLSLSDASTTVTVAAPTYDTTVYVSAAGSDANDGLSIGAPKLTFANAMAALVSAHAAGENSRLLLNRGDTFQVSSRFTINPGTTGTFYIDAYGSGDLPILEGTASGALGHTVNATNACGLRVSNVRFGVSATNGQTPVSLGYSGTSPAPRGLDVVFSGCEARDVSSSMRIAYCVSITPTSGQQDWGTDAAGDNYFVGGENVAFSDCDSQTRGYGIFGYTSRFLTVVGGNWQKIASGDDGHVIRIQSFRDASIRAATLGSGEPVRTVVRMASFEFNDSGTPVPMRGKRFTIAGNSIAVGCYNPVELQFTMAGATLPVEDLRPSHGAVLNNRFYAHPTDPYTVGPYQAIAGLNDKVVIAGNTATGNVIFYAAATPGAGEENYETLIANNSVVSSPGYSAAVIYVPSRLASPVPVTMTLKNNTVKATSQHFISGNGTSATAGLVSDHNVCDVLNWVQNMDSGDTTSKTLAAWQTYSSQDANSTAADPAFADPANDDWSIGVDSPCYDAGENIGASWLTREGTERSGTWDIGAFELGGASITITPDPATATGSTAGPSAITITGGSHTITPDPVTATLSTSGPGILISTEPLNNPPTPTLVTTLINAVPVYRSLADMARIAQGGVTKQTGDDIMKKTRSDILRRKGR
jgi:hypothetical protein